MTKESVISDHKVIRIKISAKNLNISENGYLKNIVIISKLFHSK